MSAARLLVLGAVIERGEAHGYQVRKDIESWRADLWGGLGQGSIYHALKRLDSEGLLDRVGEEHGANAPARTVYRANPRGRRVFLELLESMLMDDEGTQAETMSATGFLPQLSRDRVLDILARRSEAFQAKRDRVAKEYESDPEADWEHHVEAIDFWIRAADAEIAWTKRLIERLESGVYVMAGEK